MDDEIRQLQDIAKGDRAKQIIESEVYSESWDAYIARIHEVFCKTAAKLGRGEIGLEEATRDAVRLLTLQSAVEGSRGHIERIMNEGKLAGANLQLIEQKKRWFQRVA